MNFPHDRTCLASPIFGALAMVLLSAQIGASTLSTRALGGIEELRQRFKEMPDAQDFNGADDAFPKPCYYRDTDRTESVRILVLRGRRISLRGQA